MREYSSAVVCYTLGRAMMSTTDLCFLPLHELARRIRAREVTPVDVTKAALERIELLNSKLNAFITVMGDRALADAKIAMDEIAAGQYRGPLHGVPIGVKDLCETAGVRTTAGSKILSDWVPESDATVVRKLREAGAVIIGKTNLHEYAFGATGMNSHFGPARNPWGTAYITGGSSSGSGAAVAAGMCYAALGSDTGGSIRIPSALCGIAGIKATHGRVSLSGVVPLSWSLDHVGPMARSVRDCALVLEAIAGHDASDPQSADSPVEAWSAALEGEGEAEEMPEAFVPRLSPVGGSRPKSRGLHGVRIGVPSATFERAETDVEKAVRDAITVLGRMGADVKELPLPELEAYWRPATLVLLSEAAAYHQANMKARPQDYGDDVRERLQAGLDMKAVDYIQATRLRDDIRATCDDVLLADVDVLAMPTSVRSAARIDTVGRDDPTLGLTRLTAQFDVTGQPAMSVPCGLTVEGLPIGLQIVGKRFDEAMVFRVAHEFETRGGLKMPRPPID